MFIPVYTKDVSLAGKGAERSKGGTGEGLTRWDMACVRNIESREEQECKYTGGGTGSEGTSLA